MNEKRIQKRWSELPAVPGQAVFINPDVTFPDNVLRSLQKQAADLHDPEPDETFIDPSTFVTLTDFGDLFGATPSTGLLAHIPDVPVIEAHVPAPFAPGVEGPGLMSDAEFEDRRFKLASISTDNLGSAFHTERVGDGIRIFGTLTLDGPDRPATPRVTFAYRTAPWVLGTSAPTLKLSGLVSGSTLDSSLPSHLSCEIKLLQLLEHEGGGLAEAGIKPHSTGGAYADPSVTRLLTLTGANQSDTATVHDLPFPVCVFEEAFYDDVKTWSTLTVIIRAEMGGSTSISLDVTATVARWRLT